MAIAKKPQRRRVVERLLPAQILAVVASEPERGGERKLFRASGAEVGKVSLRAVLDRG